MTFGAWRGLWRRPARLADVPSVLQVEAVECGAASLGMILAFHGRWVSLEDLRRACGVSRDGTKASNLLRAARTYGLEAKGFRKEPDRLREMPMPVILFWGFNHFVVLEGFDRDRARINDPAVGRRVIEPGEFEAAFTGVVLAMQPGAEFRPGGTRPSLPVMMWARLKASHRALTHVALATLALVVPGLALPIFSRIFIDDVLVGRQEDWLIPLLVGLTGVLILRGALTWIQQSVLARLEVKLAVVPISQMLWRLLALPMAYFDQRHPGELANRVSVNDRIAAQFAGGLATNFANLLLVIFYALIMLLYAPLLAAVMFVLSAANVASARLSRRMLAPRLFQAQAEGGRLVAATVGPIQAIETIKSGGLEDQVFQRWAGRQAALLDVRRTIAERGVLLGLVPTLVDALGRAAMLGLGGWLVMQGQMTVGMLVAFIALAEGFTQPLAGLVEYGTALQAVRADLSRVEDVMRADPVPSPPAGLPLRSAALDVADLSFGYSPLDPPIIDRLSFAIAPGRRVALVGGSGSGKSTVGRLVVGLAERWSGDIRIDGRSLDGIARADRAGIVAYVDQDVFLFEGTVRENLTLWDDSVPERALIEALNDAEIFDDVMERPGGLDAAVIEGGGNFSGGQRQRLEIARALVGRPQLLVLDEATAALDPITEERIDAHLRRRGCACLIIAHRLSTIRDADMILVFDQGRIVERGSFQELVSLGGRFAELVQTQLTPTVAPAE